MTDSADSMLLKAKPVWLITPNSISPLGGWVGGHKEGGRREGKGENCGIYQEHGPKPAWLSTPKPISP
eukprot:351099-Chlamydomonas_euryale.AAC.4